jgi:CheY-like chemotaxis protein
MNQPNSKISLAIGFGTILVLLLALTHTALSQLATTRSYLEKVIKEYYVKTEQVTILEEAVHDQILKLQQMLFVTDPLVRKQAHSEFSALDKVLLTARSRLLQMNLTPAEQIKLKHTFILIEQTAKIQQQLAQLLLDNQIAEAQVWQREQVFSAQNAAHEAVSDFVTFERNATHQAEQQALQANQEAHLFMSILGGLVLILGGGLTWIFFHRINNFENQLIQLKAAMEATDQAKKVFLANLSHQIRTPLNAVIGMSHLLLETSLNQEQRDLVETVHTSGEAFLKLIDSILRKENAATTPVPKTYKVSATPKPVSTLPVTKMIVELPAAWSPPQPFAPIKPVAETPQEVSKPLLTTEPEKQPTPALRVLLVEDNLVNQKVAQLILKRLGYNSVAIANNGLEAIQAMEQQDYEIVLMDISMPEMDGWEATHRIHERWPPGQRPYIIAMTAYALRGDREACFAAGMDDYVAKPVHPEELAMALERGKATSAATRRRAPASAIKRSRGGNVGAVLPND